MKYNQGTVELSEYPQGISIGITGRWNGYAGTFYKHNKTVAYDFPEAIPQGLKNKILKQCIKMDVLQTTIIR